MNSSILKKQSTHFVGAIVILLGAATSSQATSLTGYATYGNMMSGMKVTANFMDGSYQSVIWNALDSQSGGVFGNGWSLTQSGNTYAPDNPNPEAAAWTLTNYGQGINSIVIDAIAGGTVFDNVYEVDTSLHTPGSERGWFFETRSGQGPSSFAYSVPIDISRGDLFGVLSLYWGTGFTGVTKFFADADSSSTTVYPKDPATYNNPPKDLTVSFAAPTIYEGQSTSVVVQATDSDQGAITFSLNGSTLGTDFTPSGVRQVATPLGPFADNGSYTYTAQARDESGYFSPPVTSVLNVLNLPPSVAAIDIPTIYEGQSATAYMYATDPGADAINFYLNGNYVGTDYNTTGTRAVATNLGNFADNGYIPYTGSALDKDGAWSVPVDSSLTILNLAPTLASFDLSQNLIYEGQSVSALLTATDPGADWQTFFIDGSVIGTDLQTFGTRSATKTFAPFSAGTYTFTASVRDKDGADGNALTEILQVLNVDPIITDLTQNLVANSGELFDFGASAFDPGGTPLTFEWDFNEDDIFDFVGASGTWSFADKGIYQAKVRVSDGKGGYAYGTFTVETVPEPSSVLGVLAFGASGAAFLWKRKQQQKG